MRLGEQLATRTRIALALGVLMLTATTPVAAMHNSAGGEVAVVQPDEVQDGELVPDIPEDSPHKQTFHDDSPMAEKAIPRPQPEDQRGERYAPGERHEAGSNGPETECTTAQEHVGDFRADVAKDGDLCYVGFMDAQREAVLFSSFLVNPLPSDLVYRVNPDPSDGYCTGQERSQDHAVAEQTGSGVDDGGPVDQTIASANRSALDDECSGAGHAQGIPGKVGVDTDLVEVAFDGSGLPVDGVAETTGTDPGSGTRTLPMLTTPYLFLFGQPHPVEVAKDAGLTEPDPDAVTGDMVEEHRLVAGEGVFSGDPAQGSAPVTNLEGACGDRTEDCVLLTPDDIRAYDPYPGTGEGDQEQARVCEFAPQFGSVNPDNRDAGLCGVYGSVMNTFKGKTMEGGFGAGTGLPTWLNMLPGWYQGVLGGSTPTTSTMSSFTFDYLDEEKEFFPGYLYYYAVNPKTPAGEDPTWCLRPNIEATGTGTGPGEGDIPAEDDPGVFGPYRADAVDADVYPASYRGGLEDVRDATHDDVRGLSSTAFDTLDNATDTVFETGGDVVDNASEALDEVPEDELDDLIPEDPLPEDPVPDEVDQAVDDAGDTAGEAFDDAVQAYSGNSSRASLFADSWGAGKGYNQLNHTQEDFQQTFDGLACNGQGVPEFQDDKALYGGLVFDTTVSQETVAIRDPTVLGEVEGVPAPARDEATDRGVWQPDGYSFGGDILGVLDTNANGGFDDCATPDGQNDPDEDFCPWQALWDAYNPGCTTFAGAPCLAQLDRAGYAVNDTHLYDGGASEYLYPHNASHADEIRAENDNAAFVQESEHGVGLYFVLRLSGPFLLYDEEVDAQQAPDRTRLVGDDNPEAQNCVVGTSQGFQKHLPDVVEAETGKPVTSADSEILEAAEVLCGEDFNPLEGDLVVVTDAFFDQSGTNRGGFSSAVSFVKLAPTPDAVVDETGIGEGDELCVGGVWSVKDRLGGATADTAGSLDFTSGSGDYPHHYGECLDFGTEAPAEHTPGPPTEQ